MNWRDERPQGHKAFPRGETRSFRASGPRGVHRAASIEVQKARSDPRGEDIQLSSEGDKDRDNMPCLPQRDRITKRRQRTLRLTRQPSACSHSGARCVCISGVLGQVRSSHAGS